MCATAVPRAGIPPCSPEPVPGQHGRLRHADFVAVMRALLWSHWRRTDLDKMGTGIKLQYQPRGLVELAALEGQTI